MTAAALFRGRARRTALVTLLLLCMPWIASLEATTTARTSTWEPGHGIAPAPEGAILSVLVPADEHVVAGVWRAAPGAAPHPLHFVGDGDWHGAHLAWFRFDHAPPRSTAILEITTRPGRTPGMRRLRSIPGASERFAARLAARVANPRDVPRFAPALRHPTPSAPHKAGARRGFHPAAYPDLEGSPVEYLIVCADSLVGDFQVLANWKTRRGMPAVVRGLGQILATTRQGSDLAETLRHFIQDAYQLWGVRWVLLGGDTAAIPARLAFSTFPTTPSEVPTDLYYAGLDGTWNANGNAVFGEAAVSALDLGDQADLLPEVAVSRAPVETRADVQLFVQKTINYETPLQTDYQNDALLLAEVLSPADYDSAQGFLLDGADLTEQLRATVLPPTLQERLLYETFFFHPGAGPLSKAAALDSLAAGPHFVNHMGHGFRFNMSVGDASIVNPEAEALTNGNRTFVLFLLNCTALAFDSNALGERYLMAPAGGAVGVVGSSREAFPSTSIFYNSNFYDALFQQGLTTLGDAVDAARVPRTLFTFFDTADRWTHLILNVLGDPGLEVFTATPQVATVVHPDSTALGTSAVAVQVAVGGVPVDSARVCLWKGDESYAVVWTDALGNATVPLTADTPGVALLTVAGRNLVTHQDSVVVLPAAPPHPYVAAVSVDDDSLGGTAGNGDGILDAGETVDLQIQVANAGGTPAPGLRGIAVSADSMVSILGDTLVFGTLAPADTSGVPLASATLRVGLGTGLVDETTVTFTLTFGDSTQPVLGSETLRRVIHAPQPEILEVQRTATGTQSDLTLRVKNYGSGAQGPATLALSSTDPDVAILQGSATLPALASQATGTAVGTLQVSETDTTQRNLIQVTLTDDVGRVLVHAFDLRAPAPSDPPVLDASPGPTAMRLTWTPAPEADVSGYHVWRRPAGSGAYVQVSDDRIAAAYFLDTGLAPNTRYDYVVTVVDSGGLASPPSSPATGSTNPPQLAGWPLPMGAPTSSSVAVGDVDGDGDLEIVTGDDHLYAWHADGTELLDGDGNALTWGVLVAEPQTLTASVALGELDPGRPGLEIVAGVWDDNRLFAYDALGAALPGWPVQPANGGTPGYWGAPTVADLDGDGVAEVLAVSKDGRLYGFDAGGQPLGGGDGTLATVGAGSRTSAVVLNLDGDPAREIVVAGEDGFLRALESDGTPLGGAWPVDLGGAVRASPAVGEVDGATPTPEIVVTSENDRLHVFTVGGLPLAGWPQSLPMDSPSFGPSPALGDVNADGRMDIAVVSNATPASASTVRLYDAATATVLLQEPLGDASESSPLLVDLDGDASIDLLVGGESGVVQAWNLAGDTLAGFPLTVGDFVRSTPFVTDVDADGDVDLLLAAWDSNVYVWDLPGAWDPSRAPWPTFAHDAGRTGNAFTPATPTDAGDAVPRPTVFHLGPTVPNPFNPYTRIHFDLPGMDHVRAVVYDARGRRVRRLLDQPLAPGRHHVDWDGRGDDGRSLAAGVYWVHFEAASGAASRKLVLLK